MKKACYLIVILLMLCLAIASFAETVYRRNQKKKEEQEVYTRLASNYQVYMTALSKEESESIKSNLEWLQENTDWDSGLSEVLAEALVRTVRITEGEAQICSAERITAPDSIWVDYIIETADGLHYTFTGSINSDMSSNFHISFILDGDGMTIIAEIE